MLLPAVVIFLLCLILGAFFAASETAFIGANPVSLEYYETKGSRRAGLVRRILARVNEFLITILVGNTLVNAAAASIATSVFVTLVPDKNKAVLLATLTTTLFILIFGEINPKTFAAHNPVRTALLVSYPIRGLMIVLFPVIKVFTIITGLLMPSSRRRALGPARRPNEEEIRLAILSGSRGLSALRRKMISGALDISARPVKEVMVPRPLVKAIEMESPLESIVRIIQSDGFSRYPVFRGRLDNVEGLIRAKDLIPYVIDKKDFNIRSVLRPALFVPELASLENVLLQMQDKAVHMAFVVDEFGNMEGLGTLEDIIEEIVGDIQDERETKPEDIIIPIGGGSYLVKGAAAVKDVKARLPLDLPEKSEYTTMAGFYLAAFGRIPREHDTLEFDGHRLTVVRMNKRHISLLRLDLAGDEGRASE